MKRVLSYFFVALLILSQSAAIAAALTLEKIGVTTVGRRISSWTYIGTNPIITGTADPSAAVSISIDGTTYNSTADGTGNWSYQPTTLNTTGSHPIILSSGSDSMSFTLALTTSTATGSATTDDDADDVDLPDELPQTGTAEQTLMLIGGGLALVLIGVMFYWKVVPKLLFEESSEDSDDHLR